MNLQAVDGEAGLEPKQSFSKPLSLQLHQGLARRRGVYVIARGALMLAAEHLSVSLGSCLAAAKLHLA